MNINVDTVVSLFREGVYRPSLATAVISGLIRFSGGWVKRSILTTGEIPPLWDLSWGAAFITSVVVFAFNSFRDYRDHRIETRKNELECARKIESLSAVERAVLGIFFMKNGRNLVWLDDANNHLGDELFRRGVLTPQRDLPNGIHAYFLKPDVRDYIEKRRRLAVGLSNECLAIGFQINNDRDAIGDRVAVDRYKVARRVTRH